MRLFSQTHKQVYRNIIDLVGHYYFKGVMTIPLATPIIELMMPMNT